MFHLENQFNRQRDWLVLLETADGRLYRQKEFRGTDFQMSCWAECLAEQAMIQGLPLKQIHYKALDLIAS